MKPGKTITPIDITQKGGGIKLNVGNGRLVVEGETEYVVRETIKALDVLKITISDDKMKELTDILKEFDHG